MAGELTKPGPKASQQRQARRKHHKRQVLLFLCTVIIYEHPKVGAQPTKPRPPPHSDIHILLLFCYMIYIIANPVWF